MPRRALPLTAVLAAVLMTSPLAGCGSDTESDRERYCATVQEHQEELGSVAAAGGPGGIIALLPTLRDLADDAPGDIRDEWRTLIAAVERLETAFEDAGADPTTYDPKRPPDGLTAGQRDRIEDAAADLAGAEVITATAGLEQQALDTCRTPLGL